MPRPSSPFDVNTPDKINTEHLKELLAAKASPLPKIPLSNEGPFNLMLAVNCLMAQAEGSPNIFHLLLTLLSLTSTTAQLTAHAIKKEGPDPATEEVRRHLTKSLLETLLAAEQNICLAYRGLAALANRQGDFPDMPETPVESPAYAIETLRQFTTEDLFAVLNTTPEDFLESGVILRKL